MKLKNIINTLSLAAVAFIATGCQDTDAQVDIERGVVVCTTLADHYVQSMAGMPNIFGPASLHLSDYPAYWDNIRENVQTRIKAYFSRSAGKSHGKSA